MILSHTKKFIFISVPKTASTVVRSELACFADIQGEDSRDSYFYHHATGKKVKEYFVKKNLPWEDYYKFAFVRNPYSKMVSEYFYALKCVNNPEIKKVAPHYYEDCDRVASKTTSFKEYVAKRMFQGMHCPCQSNWIPEDFDFIGKFENLQEDYKTVCRNIGIPYRPLPKKNKTQHLPYTSYYDRETIHLVYEKHKTTITKYNYKFGD